MCVAYITRWITACVVLGMFITFYWMATVDIPAITLKQLAIPTLRGMRYALCGVARALADISEILDVSTRTRYLEQLRAIGCIEQHNRDVKWCKA